MLRIFGKVFYTQEEMEHQRICAMRTAVALHKNKSFLKQNEIYEYVKIDQISELLVETLEKLEKEYESIHIYDKEETKNILDRFINVARETENVKYFADADSQKYICFPFKIGDILIHNKAELDIYNKTVNHLKSFQER